MIESFRNKKTEALFKGKAVYPKWVSFARVARRKLLMLEAARSLSDLKSPPGNQLEALKRDRIGQHSIRVNDTYRVCFVWRGDSAFDVEIVDYH